MAEEIHCGLYNTHTPATTFPRRARTVKFAQVAEGGCKSLSGAGLNND